MSSWRSKAGLLGLAARGHLYRRPHQRFVTAAPSAQTAVDSVSEPWASRLPLDDVVAGSSALFDDPRVSWGITRLGGIEGASCLELGPLEGGHSYMLERAGAKHVVAVEANKDAFLKCLVAKELLDMRSCSFLCGDVLAFLADTSVNFDVCWCAGILYHLVDPVRLIKLASQRASRLYLWTHYFEEKRLKQHAAFSDNTVTAGTIDGFTFKLHRQDYGVTPRVRGFWGGTQGHSNWLTIDDLIGALEHYGWTGIESQLEDHPHGPAVSLVARR